jgi:Uncharacterised protein family (UPF0182)
MNDPVGKLARCAIYTRKSSEHNLDLAFSSLNAQREACEAYIMSQAHEGWRLIPGRYDDGASLERPALQQLPLYDKDIGFYLFALPAYVVIKNWMLVTLLLSALFAGAIYWGHGHIEYDAQRRSMSPTAIAHGSVLLGFFFVVKAWSYGLDRYLLLYHDSTRPRSNSLPKCACRSR